MKIKSAVSLASLAVCAALSTSALAQNTVNFEGYVVETACTVVAGANNTVSLPTVERAALETAGTLGEVRFPVKLEDCDPSDRTYQINFSSATANAAGRLPNAAAGGAQGVSLELLTDANDVLRVTDAPYGLESGLNDPGVVVTGPTGVGTGYYKVRYYAETGVTTGKVEASALMTANVL